MEQHEHLPQPSPERKREISEAVAKKFGPGAVFAYPTQDGKTRFVTFDQGLKESGHHFAHLPAEIIIAMLEPMYQPGANNRESQQRTLGRQALPDNPGV